MKKIIIPLLVLCMVIALVACEKTPAPENPTISSPTAEDTQIENTETPTESESTEAITDPTEEITQPEETQPEEEAIIDMGEAGQEIWLSELEAGKTYLFHVNEMQAEFFKKVSEGTFTALDLYPHVFNDTEHMVVNLAVIINDGEVEEHTIFNEKNTLVTSAPLGNYIWTQSMSDEIQPAKTLKISYTPTTLSDEFIADNTINLSNWKVDEEIDMNHRNYLFNDTKSVLTIEIDVSDGENSAVLTYELEPNEVLEAHMLYKIKIANIN